MKLCEKCNKINDDNAEVCRYCGEPFELPFGFNIIDDLDADSAEQISNEVSSNSDSAPKEENNEPDKLKKEFYIKKKTVIPKEEYEVKNLITIDPPLNGRSVKYAGRIAAHGSLDKIRCPKCGSDNISFISNTQKQGFSGSDACCGYMILGPLGILCGSVGANKTSTTEYWVCAGCGNKFQSSSGNDTKAMIQRNAALLYDIPDETIDNADVLYQKSLDQLKEVRKQYNQVALNEYKSNPKMRTIAIVAASITLLALIAFLLTCLFDSETIVSVVCVLIAVLSVIVSFAIKPKMEKKYANEPLNSAILQIDKASEITKKLKAIKEAKGYLSKKGII